MTVEAVTVTSQEALQMRIGREATPGVTAFISYGLIESMRHGALAYRALFQADLDQARREATSAIVLLFPDGPVQSDRPGKYSLRPSFETAGEHAQKIVAAFMDGVTHPLATAFGEMADLVDAINARGIASLKSEFLNRTPSEIPQEADRLWNKFMAGEGDRETEPELWYQARRYSKIIAGLTGRLAPPDPDEMDELDEFLQVVVQSVEGSTDYARAHLKDSPTTVDEALDNARDLLTTIMAGNVDEWIE